MTAWGKVPGPLRRHAGLHRQPRQPAVHARGAARCSRPGDGGVERDRRGGPRRRLPDGPVRADGPRRHRRQPGRRAWASSSGRALPAIRSPSGSGRRRSRSAWSPPAGSAGRRARASTATTTTGRPSGRRRLSRAAPRRRRPPAHAAGPHVAATAIAERIALAIVNEAYRALGEGVATAADIDLALRLGAGHPVGPFERADALGGPAAVLACVAPRYAAAGPRFESGRPASPRGGLSPPLDDRRRTCARWRCRSRRAAARTIAA